MSKGDIADLRVRFSKADSRFGPVALWWWSGEPVRADRLRWQLQRLSEAGIANLCVINLAPVAPTTSCSPDEPTFASEAWWDLFATALDEAERIGSRLWFYDQLGFSSANIQARLVSSNPDMAGHRLVRVAPGTPDPLGAVLVAEVDGARFVSIREGFDWLSPCATGALLDRVHGELERRFGDRLGRSLAGTFQDELPPLPQWSPDLPARYQDRFGEDLLSVLPSLYEASGDAARVRRGFFSILGEMAEEAFFKPLRSWHEEHGMLVGCDQAGSGRAGDPHGAQRLYLDYMRTHRWFSAPGADMDGEAKPHSSMAHLYGGRRVWLEGFHSSGWGGTIEETLHWLLPWLHAGVTLFNPHAVYYSTRGGWWEWAPPDTGWRQPYAEHYPIFADTVARACSVLSEGDHVCDVAVYYPASAVWEHCSLSDGKPGEHPHAVAERDPDSAVHRIREVYWKLTGRLGRHESALGVLAEDRRDFDLLDEAALAAATVAGGILEIAGERYRSILLPSVGPRDPKALEKLARFAAEGGMVCVVAPLAEEGIPEGVAVLERPEDVPGWLVDLPRPVEGPGCALHRRVGEADIFLLMAPVGTLVEMIDPATRSLPPDKRGTFTHSATTGRPTITPKSTYLLRVQGTPQLWDPVSGVRSKLHFKRTPEGLRVDVPFDDWPAALVVCTLDDGKVDDARAVPHRRVFPAVLPDTDCSDSIQQLPSGGWEVCVVPILDNRFGDFDLQVRDSFLAPEIRVFRVRHETDDADGVTAGWQLTDFDDDQWLLRHWSESGSWSRWNRQEDTATPVVMSEVFGTMGARTWAGRMGRIPREFLDLGRVAAGESVWVQTYVVAPRDGRYWLVLEGSGEKAVEVDGKPTEVEVINGGHVGIARLKLRGGTNKLTVLVRAVADGVLRLGVAVGESKPEPQPVWLMAPDGNGEALMTHVDCGFSPKAVKVHFAVRGKAELWVNGQRVSILGGFNSYRNEGEDVVDLASHWKSGLNEINVVFPEPDSNTAFLLDGIAYGPISERLGFCTHSGWKTSNGRPAVASPGESSSEAHWVRPRPHLLGDVGWLTMNEVPSPPPLRFVGALELVNTPVWLRFTLPVGSTTLAFNGTELSEHTQLWVDGDVVQLDNGRASFPIRPGVRKAALRIIPDDHRTEAAVLRAPISVGMTKTIGSLGDWRQALGLTNFSGAVDYERKIPSNAHSIDLGYVRGTAEVWVDGVSCGVRCWHPYRFRLPEPTTTKPRQLRVRVANTLGAHYSEGRPSAFVSDAQAASGLFGPVLISDRP